MTDQIGSAMAIRSDEWFTQTPLELGALANGSLMHSPLSQEPDIIYQVSSGGFFETILFAEGNLLRLGQWLPDAMLFASFRGFSWLLLFLTMPPLLRRLGATRPLSWLGTMLCFLAPASLWWSFMPIRILAFAAAGCYLLFLARDLLVRRRPVLGGLVAVLAGLCLARLVTFYVPWSYTMGVPLVLATGVFLLRERATRRASATVIGIGAAAGLVLLVGTMWENWAALHAELNTVYPGERRVTGEAQRPFQLFGAPGLGTLELNPQPTLLNQSEISSAFLVCGAWAAVFWSSARLRATRPQWAAVVALAAILALTMSWAVVAWGPIGEHVPVLNTLLPGRAAQTIGYPATVLLCLVLSRIESCSPARALIAAAVGASITAYGVSDLRYALPELGTLHVWGAAFFTGFMIYVVSRWPRHWIPTVAVTVALAAAAWGSNPITFGLGDLRNSPAAAKARGFAAQAEKDGGLWASDNTPGSALLMANGVPSMSGFQVTGPNHENWERLDPERTAEEAWNRGASYLYMTFSLPEGSPPGQPSITAPANDGIMVYVEPCWLAESGFGVTHLLAAGDVDSPCAKKVSSLFWAGYPMAVYDLSPAGSGS